MCDNFYFMKLALEQARIAFDRGEVPVGAVLVYEGKVIAKAHNRVEEFQEASKHAEMQCLQEASKTIGNWRLLDCTLYTTLEPCAMCGGALILSRIKKVVYGATDFRHGCCVGWTHFLQEKHPIHQVEVLGGVLAEESSKLLKEFFTNVRKKNDIKTV